MTQCNIVKIQFELLPTFHLDARRDIFAPSYVTLVLAINSPNICSNLSTTDTTFPSKAGESFLKNDEIEI